MTSSVEVSSVAVAESLSVTENVQPSKVTWELPFRAESKYSVAVSVIFASMRQFVKVRFELAASGKITIAA